MRRIDQLLAEYGESHRNALNKSIHWICVPAIFFSIVGLLWSIPVPSGLPDWVNVASATLLLVVIYYVRLSPLLAAGMLIFALLCMWLADYLQENMQLALWKISIGIFVLAWIGQFYGHHVEGKKPSFIKDLQFLLIGPAWLMHFIYRKLGVKF